MSIATGGPTDYKVVTSPLNPRVKEARSLLRKKFRVKTGKFLIEGAKFVGDAFYVGAKVETVFFTEAFAASSRWEQLVQAAGSQKILERAEWVQVPEQLLASLSDTETPQGIVAVAQMLSYNLDDFRSLAHPLFLVADRIQDPGNLGTMIRTAAGAGFHGIFLTRGTVDVYSSKVLRATTGSIFRIPIVQMDTEDAIQFIKELGCQIVVGDIGELNYHYEVDYAPATAIVIGNEGSGPSKHWVEAADCVVQIPLAKDVESLNAAVAAAIIMYEAVRQRHSKARQTSGCSVEKHD